MTEIAAAAAAYIEEVLDLVENVTSSMRQQWLEMSGKGSLMDTILSFVRAVDWTEPWLIALFLFHVVLLVSAVLTRKNNSWQTTLFLFGFVGVYYTERLNTVLDNHWKRFARQPYFDSHGLFLSTVWSVPILLTTTVIVVNSLVALVNHLVKCRRAELMYRSRMEKMEKRKAD